MGEGLANRIGLCCGASVLALLLAGEVNAAEEQTIDAFAAWQAQGEYYATGKTTAMATLALTGQMYVQTPQGPVYAGELVCPGTMDLNVSEGTQAGSGRCMISGKDGAKVFAKWSCKGAHMIGCEGEFSLTGGTGRFDGVTGSGPLLVRSNLHEMRIDMLKGRVEGAATGIMVWKNFRYQMP